MPGKLTKRTPFTDEDDKLLVKYLAKYNTDGKNRRGKRIWEILVGNADDKWPWAKRHTSQSWLEHYKKNDRRFDMLIAKRIKDKGYADRDQDPPRPPPPAPEPGPSNSRGKRPRQEFTREEELNLVKFLAIENPGNSDRMGNTLYKRLARDEKGLWPWHTTHPWTSWREKYKKRGDEFDEMISNYQQRFKINTKRDVDPSLWDKLPAHVQEEDVEPIEDQLVESGGDEEAEDEYLLRGDSDGDTDELDELASDLDDEESTAEVSQLLKQEGAMEEAEDADAGVGGEGEGEGRRDDREGEGDRSNHERRSQGSRRSSRSRSPPRGPQTSKARGKRRHSPETTDEEPDELVEKQVAPIRPSAQGKQRALKKVIAGETRPQETSSAPAPAAKKRKLFRRPASEVERPAERPIKRRRAAAVAIVVSDSDG